MSEESLREIIGIARKTKWKQIQKFIKFIIENTLKRNAEYRITALDVSINGVKKPKYDQIIKNKEQIKGIDHLSLYQATPTANNHISLSQNNGTIIVLAKYWGPEFNEHQSFDFSVNLDALDEPFFTIGNGKKVNCSEILKIFSTKAKPQLKTQKIVQKEKKEEVKDTEIKDIEIFVFEKLTNKNAIWNETETKSFQTWKAKTKNKYHIDTGKITHYKGSPTKQFTLYLKSLVKSGQIKDEKPYKKIDKKPSSPKKDKEELTEHYIFKTIAGKNAIWNGVETKTFQNWKVKTKNKYRSDTGKISHYKGKPTKEFSLHLKSLIKSKQPKEEKPKETIDKNPPSPKKDKQELTEPYVFKTITGKNAIWNGSETQNFLKWKKRNHNQYQKDTGKNPYYNQKLTKNFKDYLVKRFKI
jgi:hypothetical protein